VRELVVETKYEQRDTTPVIPVGKHSAVALTPDIGEDYWVYRVRLSDTQAILGFQKFGTIGIGFAIEEDWNSNLPFRVDAMRIFKHISHNKGDDSIADEECIRAIKLIQDAARQDHVLWCDRQDECHHMESMNLN
jgi:hypothetical protein